MGLSVLGWEAKARKHSHTCLRWMWGVLFVYCVRVVEVLSVPTGSLHVLGFVFVGHMYVDKRSFFG